MNAGGLSEQEARHRLALGGPNEIEQEKPRSFLMIVLSVIREPMFILLLSCATIYFLLGPYTTQT